MEWTNSVQVSLNKSQLNHKNHLLVDHDLRTAWECSLQSALVAGGSYDPLHFMRFQSFLPGVVCDPDEN